MRAFCFHRSLLQAIPAVLCLALAGCSKGVARPQSSKMVITRSKAAFFKQGPAQPGGSDLELTKGQRVTLVATSLGYSRVVTTENLTGYIATDSLAPAPYEPPPPATPKPWAGDPTVYTSLPKPGSDIQSGGELPLFDLSDTPPMPAPVELKPKQGFDFRF